MELTTEQEKILPFLDGTRTVEQLMEHSGLCGEFGTVAKALYGAGAGGFRPADRTGRHEGEESPPEETQS